MRTLIYIAGTAAILAAAFVVIQRAKPNSLPVGAPEPTNGPTITWSVPQLTQTMFPGITSTVNVSFQSTQNLAGVAVSISPSLNGIVSASPATFASIAANQPYQIALTLSAPAAFIKQSFGGAIQLRNAGWRPENYAPALAVNLQTDWNVLTDATTGFLMFYPLSLYNITDSSTPNGIYDLESSPGGVALGGAVLEGSPVATSGFAITIQGSSFNASGTFDINHYLADRFLDLAPDANVIPMTIGGEQGYVVTFEGEEGGNQPLAIVYHNDFLYNIKYSSTDYIDGFSDQDGLTAFSAILQHFSFSR